MSTMSEQISSKGKGKAKIEVIDLTVDVPLTANKAVQVQQRSPASPSRDAQPTISNQAGSSKDVPSSSTRANPCTPTRAGSSYASSHYSFSPTQSTKRKAQQACITSFFPAKKFRIETIPPELSPEQKKALREEDKMAKADARRLARELEREKREEKKAAEDVTKAVKAAERRLKKEARDAEAARKREMAQWKADWKNWVQRNRQPDVEFTMPKGEEMWVNHMNVTGTKVLGLTRYELDCLPHCAVDNPLQPAGEEWAPMMMFRIDDVERLAFRKEGIVSGVSQDDEAVLLREGEERLKTKMEKRDNQQAG